MSQTLPVYEPDISHLITEDDTPVDNILSEKQQRLLTEPLYSSWEGPGADRSFVALANVGVFYLARNPAIVPDVLFSADVEMPTDFSRKENRSYFLWEFGKPPDIAIEIVSNKDGGEDGEKKQKYARIKVEYYVIYDPLRLLMPAVLTVYHLRGFAYERVESAAFPAFNLSLVLWQGQFEDSEGEWLRWADARGNLILTGKELAKVERQRAEHERQRADRLADKLRQLGLDPEQL
jgi:Uma2 family endonuclease